MTFLTPSPKRAALARDLGRPLLRKWARFSASAKIINLSNAMRPIEFLRFTIKA